MLSSPQPSLRFTCLFTAGCSWAFWGNWGSSEKRGAGCGGCRWQEVVTFCLHVAMLSCLVVTTAPHEQKKEHSVFTAKLSSLKLTKVASTEKSARQASEQRSENSPCSKHLSQSHWFSCSFSHLCLTKICSPMFCFSFLLLE